MNSAIIIVVAIAFGCLMVDANPARLRREEDYCGRHATHYVKFCRDASSIDRSFNLKISKFCNSFEKICGDTSPKTEEDTFDSPLVIPPELPRGNEALAFDLPLSDEPLPIRHQRRQENPSRLSAEIVVTCTPDCTASHCTDECKCANTHPRVHQLCNPPSSATMAQTCQKWYAKCTMFTPVEY